MTKMEPAPDTSEPSPQTDVNQDELIMAQEKQIEKDIADRTPLIGDKDDLMTLQDEYNNEDVVYQQKVEDLRTKYSHIRRARGDGNCFFRSFAFAYLESLLHNKDEYSKFKEIILKSKDSLVAMGFPQFTIEDFYDTYIDVVKQVGDGINDQDLLDIFNDPCRSDYIVVYMRLLTSGQLQKEADFYTCFLEGGREIKDFCNQEVEPMYKESDHIHIIALTSALSVGVRIEYMDRGQGSKVTSHDFPEDSKPLINLLYRPGHYDVLYKIPE